MSNEIIVQHVAVECSDQQSADRFFTGVLGIPKVKSSILSKELSAAIFKINKSTTFELYDNGMTRFEVFITSERREPTYNHICIKVNNKNDFVTRCKQQGLDSFFVEKNGKQLLFVRDFSDNLFEVIER
jgi:catechol 2,3-dioxygenase-like lactoylglutathione lyase family enzyme